MSKTISAFTTTAIDNPHLKPIRLIRIAFSGITMRLCDRSFGADGAKFTWNGHKYEPIVLEWGDIDLGEIDVLGKNPPQFGETRFTVDNYIPVFGYDNFLAAISDNDYLTGAVRIFEIFDGASSTDDEITKFVGRIENPELEAATVIVNCVDVGIEIVNKFAPEVCNIAVYPGADPNDIGKIFPIVFGRAKKVPFLSIDAGTLDVLSEELSAVGTTIYASDATGFSPTGGTVQVDLEQIYYSGVSGTTLTGCTRGYNDTEAVVHNVGAVIAEVQTSYIFLIGHPVTQFDAVYVQNSKTGEHVLQNPSTYTTYTGQSGDEIADYPGKAAIVFNTLPVITQQINVEVIDTIDTLDTIDVPDPGHTHNAGGSQVVFWYFDTAYHSNPEAGGYVSSPGALCDNNTSVSCGIKNQGTQVTLERVLGQSESYEPYRVRVHIRTGNFLDSNCGASVSFMGASVSTGQGSSAINTTYTSGWVNTTMSWDQVLSQSALVTRTGANALGYSYIAEVWAEFEISVGMIEASVTDIEKTGTVIKIGTVELSGNSVADTVIGGAVSADVQGWSADSSGYYGTSGSVIERPDYIVKKFLVYYCGLSATSDFGTTYTQAGTDYDTYGVRLAVVLLEHENPLDFLTGVAFHSRSIHFFEDGDHQLVYLPNQSTINKTFADTRIIVDSLKLGYTPRAEVINKISANYNRYWVESWDKDIIEASKSGVVVESADSISAYGELSSTPIYLDYITGEVQATSMLEWYLGEVEFPTLLMEIDCLNYADDVMRGDIISISFSAGTLMAIVTSGLITSGITKFRVINIVQHEDNRTTIYCRSCNT